MWPEPSEGGWEIAGHTVIEVGRASGTWNPVGHDGTVSDLLPGPVGSLKEGFKQGRGTVKYLLRVCLCQLLGWAWNRMAGTRTEC